MSATSCLRLFWLSDANTAHTERWVRALAARGHDVLLFSLIEPRSDALRNIPGVRVESAGVTTDLAYSEAGGMRKLAYVRAVPTIRSLARRFKPHICHTHYVSSYGVLGMLAGLRPHVASIWGSDVYTTPFRSVAHRFAINRVMRSADTVLSTSWIMREQGLKICRRPIGVVAFGIDTERFTPPPVRSDKDGIVVGTVKSLEDKYGIDVLIEAFAIAQSRFAGGQLRLLIAGGGSRRKALESLVARLGIGSAVTFTGTIEYASVHKVHQELDIAVFPSIEDSESFGVSVVEAQACARPVIVSRVGGLPEVVREGSTGLIVEPRDKVALADAILRLLGDPALARSFGEAGRAHVCANYDLQRTVDLLQCEYRKLL